jgi:hypothetical protein
MIAEGEVLDGHVVIICSAQSLAAVLVGGMVVFRVDHLLPHAEKAEVAHPLMLGGEEENDKIDAGKIADCLRAHIVPDPAGFPKTSSAAARTSLTTKLTSSSVDL